jgi:ankyrin repeat protein
VLQHGADVDHIEPGQGSTLGVAVTSLSLISVELLIRHGANHDVRDHDGDAQLHDAIFWNEHQMAPLLLDQGASLEHVNNDQRGVLHLLAFHADVEMIDIFAERKQRFRGVSAKAKDASDKAPVNLLNNPERAYLPPPELHQAFEDLLDGIDALEPEHCPLDRSEADTADDGSDEEFFDAEKTSVQ